MLSNLTYRFDRVTGASLMYTCSLPMFVLLLELGSCTPDPKTAAMTTTAAKIPVNTYRPILFGFIAILITELMRSNLMI